MPIATLIATGWSAGLNAYLTLGILGFSGRLGWADNVPSSLQQTWVLIATAVMFAVEFVIDKVPLLDSLWDLGHTVIRPTLAAAMGAAMAGEQLGQPWASVLAGGLALIGHGSKATSRLAINVSPEPLTNIVASVAEDGIVATLVALAIASPRLAATVAVAIAVIGLIAAVLLFRVARKGWRKLRRRGQSQPAAHSQA